MLRHIFPMSRSNKLLTRASIGQRNPALLLQKTTKEAPGSAADDANVGRERKLSKRKY